MKKIILVLVLLFCKAQANIGSPMQVSAPLAIEIFQSKGELNSLWAAIDENGNVITVWKDAGSEEILSKVFNAKENKWDSIQKLSNVITVDLSENILAFSKNDNGNAVGVWGGNGISLSHYDSSSKKWLPHVEICQENICSSPSIALNDQGHAIAIWHNKTTGEIQTSHFDKNTSEWSEPWVLAGATSFWGFYKHHYTGPTKVVLDNKGNGIAIWQEKNEGEHGAIQSAYFDCVSNSWTKIASIKSAITALEKDSLGYDISASKAGNILLAVSHLIGRDSSGENIPILEVFIWDTTKKAWTLSDRNFGISPIVSTNDLNHQALAYFYISEKDMHFFAVTKDLNNPSESWWSHMITETGSILFYDLAMDGRGNMVTACSKIAKEDQEWLIGGYFNRNKKEWTIHKLLFRGPVDSLYDSMSVDVNSQGQSVILWSHYDAIKKFNVLNAVFLKG